MFFSFLQPLLTLRNLGVLIEIFHWAPLPELLAPYQQALAQYCELALEVGVSEEHRARLESVLAGTTPSEPSLRGRGLLELEGSHLSCRLALARSKLERGMVSRGEGRGREGSWLWPGASWRGEW